MTIGPGLAVHQISVNFLVAAQRDIPRDSVKVRCDKSGTIIKGSVALHVLESGIVVVVPLIRTVLVCV